MNKTSFSVILLALIVTSVKAGVFSDDFSSYANVNIPGATTGTAPQITSGTNGWKGINWKDFSDTGWGPSGWANNGILNLAAGNAGVYAAYNTTSGPLTAGSSASIDIIYSASGDYSARGLVLNLTETTASKNFYFVGINRNETTGKAELSVLEANGMTANGDYGPTMTGWTTKLLDHVNTGLTWDGTNPTINLEATLTAAGKINIAFGSYSTSVDDSASPVAMGGYAGVSMSQWDSYKLDNFAVVPEPASLGLLLMGAVGLLRRRR
jgi:hypothetical protein